MAAAPKLVISNATTSAIEKPTTASPDALQSAAMALLNIESTLRDVRSLAELHYFMVNEPRKLTGAQQICVFSRGRGGKLSLRAITAVGAIDPSAPLVMWMEDILASLGNDNVLNELREFNADAFCAEAGSYGLSYPLRELLWTPVLDLDGRVIGGVIQARSTPWTDQDMTVSRHIAAASAPIWLAVERRQKTENLPFKLPRWGLASSAFILFLAGFIPVSMSALAPVEVIPKNAFVVTSGTDGVIEQVLVEPNVFVKKGQLLVKIQDTVLRNRYEIAQQEVLVAKAKHKKSSQLAFVDMRGRQELGISKTELKLKRTERDFAKAMLERTKIHAAEDGIAFFTDKKELIGKPVAMGEKLMEIANPNETEFRIDLPAADAIVLKSGARVKVFLDSDPLHPLNAVLVRSDYQAVVRENQNLSFRLIARHASNTTQNLRLGIRGTAQVYSEKVSLAFYLFRRPIAAARQWLGV